MDTRKLGDGRIRVSWTGVAGRQGLVPQLVLKGKVLANGYGAGAIAQIEAEATLTWETPGGYLHLGQFGSKSVLLRFASSPYLLPDAPPADEMSMDIELSLFLPPGSIEALEQTRQGAGFSLLLDSTVVLIDGGEPTGPRTSEYYATLSVRTGQDTLGVAPHDWGAVLEGWKRGMGITVLVPLGATDPNPLRVEIVEHLRIARVKLDGADYTGSIAQTRQALELLKGLRSPTSPPPPLPSPRDRDPLQRILAVVDAQYNFASAPAHTDPPVKNFTPDRADAIAAAAGAASVAQQIFAWLDK